MEVVGHLLRWELLRQYTILLGKISSLTIYLKKILFLIVLRLEAAVEGGMGEHLDTCFDLTKAL